MNKKPPKEEEFSKDEIENYLFDDLSLDSIDDYIIPEFTNFKVVDTFRYFHPSEENAYTCWNTFTNARSNNFGTRIDYIFTNKEILSWVRDTIIQQDIIGSDHCPVKTFINIEPVPSSKIPEICTCNFPEFHGKQRKLLSFFKSRKDEDSSIIENDNSSKEICDKRNNLKRKSEDESVSKSHQTNKVKQAKLSSFFNVKSNRKVENKSNESKNDNKNMIESNISPSLIEENSFVLKTELNKESKSKWGFLMQGPKPAPLCPGHKEPCALRTVRKKGPNYNKQFYACAKGVGKEGDPNAQCNFFQWYGK